MDLFSEGAARVTGTINETEWDISLTSAVWALKCAASGRTVITIVTKSSGTWTSVCPCSHCAASWRRSVMWAVLSGLLSITATPTKVPNMWSYVSTSSHRRRYGGGGVPHVENGFDCWFQSQICFWNILKWKLKYVVFPNVPLSHYSHVVLIFFFHPHTNNCFIFNFYVTIGQMPPAVDLLSITE